MRMPEQEVIGPGHARAHSLGHLLLGLIAIAGAKQSGLQVFVTFSAHNKLEHFNCGKGLMHVVYMASHKFQWAIAAAEHYENLPFGPTCR